MSDSKRTGSRDISDLKARLGLKKKGAAAPAAGSGGSGGLAPPPGMNLPAPPVQPPQPMMPNAADDPFGAMNAMAAVGTVQRAPEIVIVHDGKPVEHIGASGGAATILKIVIPAVAMLGIGIGVGRISQDANSYNDGLKGVRSILGDPKSPSTVLNVKKSLSDLDGALDDMNTKTSYRPDAAVDKQLSSLALRLDVKSELVFRAKQNSLDAEVAGQILSFYAGVSEIKLMIDNHVKSAKGDDISLAKGKEAADAATLKDTDNALLAGQMKYGILIQAPTETDKTDFGAKIVELAGVYCGGATNPTARCGDGEGPSGFAYRNEPGGTPIKGDLTTSGSDSVPTKKIVLLLQNGIRDALIKGGEAGASEVFYVKRVRAIADRAKKLIEEANKLETRLNQEANKGSRFSFFM